MQVLEMTTTPVSTLPARSRHLAATSLCGDMDRVADCPPAKTAQAQPRQVDALNSLGQFTEADIRKLQDDDAMAAGMIGVILSLAFMVLLSITIGVNIWMLSFH
jgi:hypothetical protein